MVEVADVVVEGGVKVVELELELGAVCGSRIEGLLLLWWRNSPMRRLRFERSVGILMLG